MSVFFSVLYGFLDASLTQIQLSHYIGFLLFNVSTTVIVILFLVCTAFGSAQLDSLGTFFLGFRLAKIVKLNG